MMNTMSRRAFGLGLAGLALIWTIAGLALLIGAMIGFAQETEVPAGAPALRNTQVVSLDGTDWRIATDPKNEGREARWFDAPRTEAKPTPVPWVIQNIFPGYHGVAWYWRNFVAPANPHKNGYQ